MLAFRYCYYHDILICPFYWLECTFGWSIDWIFPWMFHLYSQRWIRCPQLCWLFWIDFCYCVFYSRLRFVLHCRGCIKWCSEYICNLVFMYYKCDRKCKKRKMFENWSKVESKISKRCSRFHRKNKALFPINFFECATKFHRESELQHNNKSI